MTRLVPKLVGRAPVQLAAAVAAALALAACEEETPTSVGAAPLPPEPVSVEIQLPWSQFASNLEVFGGYGRTDDVDEAILARPAESIKKLL